MRIGSADAPLTVVEFVDFECPACAAFYRTLKRFQAAHPKDVAVVLQHYPLDIHPNAVRLARTVDCAAQHGRLEAIQDSIFTRQPAMIGLTPPQFASMVGIADTADFARCISDSTRTRRVDEGRAAARRLNIIGTPTIVANGKQYRQLVDSVVLHKALEDSRRGRQGRSP